MKKLLFTTLSIISFFSASAQYDQNALTVLDAMSSRFKQMAGYEIVWQEKLVNKAAGVEDTEPGSRTITVKGKKFVLDIPAFDQILFYNGEVLHRFNPSGNEVTVVNDFDPEEEFDIRIEQIYDIYKDGYKYSLLETRANGDRVIVLNPEKRDPNFIKMEMVINSQDLIDLFIIYSDGGNQNHYMIKSIKEKNLDDAYFTFDFKNNPNVEVLGDN